MVVVTFPRSRLDEGELEAAGSMTDRRIGEILVTCLLGK